MVTLLALTLAAVVASPVQAAAREHPCERPPYRAFDFWLGTWEVFDASGEKAGDNRITREQDGCLLLESWRGRGGGTGQSQNFYDPVGDHWRQVWVSPGVIIDIQGGVHAASMVLVGDITYLASGERFPFRGMWTPLPDGRVRQFFEESRVPGQWTAWFEGFYQRAERQP
ncbi:MAG: hypothetical protein R3E86_11315 [Pseudomonadales bacterium]